MTPHTFQFHHATVIFTNPMSEATKEHMPKVFVQIIDSYRYQREWILERKHQAGNSKVIYWESHIYRHPGVRCIKEVTEKAAIDLMEKFQEFCWKYPKLLFSTVEECPLHEGFVHFADRLLSGESPHQQML